MRRLLLVVQASLALAFTARALERVDIDIVGGFDNMVPAIGKLVPVAVTIANDSLTSDGVIEIIKSPSMSGHEVTEVYPFNSPAPSIQRFNLITRLTPDDKLRVRVRFKKRIATVMKDSFTQANRKKLVLCVGTSPAYQKALPKSVLDSYLFLPVRPNDLPAAAPALDSVHALFIAGIRFADLAPDRARAVRDWVALGGILLIVNPANDIGFARNWDLISGDDGPPSSDGFRRFGCGLVGVDRQARSDASIFILSPEKQHQKAGKMLFPDVIRREHDAAVIGRGEGLFNRLTQIQGSYGLSGFLWLTVIVGLYLIVIGPVDYWLVKRTGKPYLTWVIFLAAIGGFSVLAFWYSNLVHSGTMQMVGVNIVDVAVGQELGRGNSMLWVYSSKNRRYEFASSAPGVLLSAREGSLGAGSVAGVTVANAKHSTISAKIPIFSSKTFDATWPAKLKENVQYEETDGVEQFRLPKAWQVRRALLADANSLITLCYNDKMDSWSDCGRAEMWEKIFISYARSQERRSHSKNLPAQETIEDLLTWISFGHKPGAWEKTQAFLPRHLRQAPAEEPQDDSGSPFGGTPAFGESETDVLNDCDSRETGLNINAYVKGGGRVLMLFCDAGVVGSPLKIDAEVPQTVTATLLRVHLTD